MGYYNPVMAYGEEAYVRDAAAAGADGFIVPDLPPEEAVALESAASSVGLALIHFLSPTSNPQRVETVLERARGFIYMVSLTGITGSQSGPARGLADFVHDVRRRASVPVAVGFGIRTPEQARQVAGYADGIIVGTALIEAVNAAEAAREAAAAAAYVQNLRDGLKDL